MGVGKNENPRHFLCQDAYLFHKKKIKLAALLRGSLDLLIDGLTSEVVECLSKSAGLLTLINVTLYYLRL